MMKIAFIGDISLNDAYVKASQNSSNPFKEIGQYLANFDEVVGNMESMCKSNEGENHLKSPRLKTSLQALEYLAPINLSVALLANNHIYDNYDEGYNKTKKFLDEQSIKTVGSGLSQKLAEKPLFLANNGISICLLNYVHQNTNPKPHNGTQVYLNYFEENRIVEEIQRYKQQADHVIVTPHWGGDFECGSYPNPIQSEQAKKFIDSGASAVIGHHSHTLQPVEYYKGRPILHSLGNFCFADIQEFGHEVHNKLGKESVIAELELTKNDVELSLTPIINDKLEIKIDTSGEVLKRLKKRNKRYKKLKESAFRFNFYAKKHKYFDTFYFFFFGNNRYFFDRLKHVNFKRIKYFILRK